MADKAEGSEASDAHPRTGRRRWRRWILGIAVVVVVAAVAVPFIYIHLIEGPAPAKLRLPTASPSASASSPQTLPAHQDDISGTWHVGPASRAGYRVQEVLIGQHATAVGRTAELWGTVTISGNQATATDISVDMASVKSDQSQRNAQFQGRIMDVARYPTATLRLVDPIDLGSTTGVGRIQHYRATGELNMHGVTRKVTFPISAEHTADGIEALAEVPITFSEWDIANPSVGGFVTTASSGTIEVLLALVRGNGNPAHGAAAAGTTSPGGPGAGAPSQVTVPRTTVPPLTIPAGG